jgi:hypothetical protein
MPAIDKYSNSSLLQKSVNYRQKSFKTFSPGNVLIRLRHKMAAYKYLVNPALGVAFTTLHFPLTYNWS